MKLFGRTFKAGELWSTAKNALLVLLGTATLAFGTAVFLIPFNLIAGGMSGIAIILDKLLPFPNLTVDLIITIETWLLFALGAIFLGRAFAAKTLLSTIFYPPCITLALRLVDPDVMNGYFYLANTEHGDLALLIAAVAGGAITGAGCALSFLGGGSTGGTDVIAFLLCKTFPRFKSSTAVFLVDAAVVALGMFVIRDMIVSLLGIVTVIMSALVIDRIFLGGEQAFIAEIVSEKYEQINRSVIEQLERTTSVIEITGGYSGERKHMLMVSFTMRQYADLMRIITRADREAFVTIHRAHEINGEGWTR